MNSPATDAPGSEASAHEMLASYAVDGMIAGDVVLPNSIDEVTRAMASASAEGRAVIPLGGGTLASLGNLPRKYDLALGTSRLAGVLYHEPADLVASVQAGTTVTDLRSLLAKGGQTLPLDSPFPDQATIGGVIAAGYSGPSRLSFGEPRDWLIGIKVVMADGRVSKAGGRVVKNVTGYDLCKLYSGSLGTMGVIVEANFKLTPLPDDHATIIGAFDGPGGAFQAACSLLSLTYHPHSLVLIDGNLTGQLSEEALDGGKLTVLVSHSGRRSAVKRKVQDTTRILQDSHGACAEIPSGNDEALWQKVIDLDWRRADGPEVVLRASMLPSQVAGFWAAFHDDVHPGMRRGMSCDVGMGVVKLCYWADDGSGPAQEGPASPVLDLVKAVREKAWGLGANLVVQRCPPSVKAHIDVWGEGIEGLEVMRRIKDQMDPTNTLNPGRFVGGL